MKRRKMRRYHNMKRNSGVKFLGFVGIMVGAVICGYLTARFVVAPLLGYETEVLKLDFPSKLTSLTEGLLNSDKEKDGEQENEATESTESTDSENTDTDATETEQATQAEQTTESELATEAEQTGSYVLQFGVFSTKSGAEELVQSLKKKDIEAEVKKVDGSYKVLSDTFDTKAAALKELETLKDKQNIDVFITVMN